MDYIKENLIKLLEIPSPSGSTTDAISFVQKLFDDLGLKTYLTNKGALVASLDGKDNSKEVTLSGHVDTLGAMVKEVKSDGKLKLTQLGGYTWATIEGEHVLIETMDGKKYTGTVMTNKASSHVHGSGTDTVERNSANMEVRIDERVASKEDTLKLGISVGDFVHLDPRAMVTPSGFVKSRHLDDKAGVIALLGMAKYLVENKITPNYKTNFFISNYEEVGHGASAGIPENTFEFIAVDMAAPGEGQTSDEYSVTICAKDSSGPYDLEIRKKLTQLAIKHELNYKVDIYPYYSSDGSAALRSGHNFKVGLIGPGVDASHSFERTHLEAIDNTIKLGIAYLTD